MNSAAIGSEPQADEADAPAVTERANDYAMRALTRMRDEQVPPTPENFAVWYSYYARRNPALNNAIDAIVNAKLPFDRRRCRQLYDEYISHNREKVAVRSVTESIDNIMKTVGDLLSSAGVSSDRFGSVLQHANAAMDRDLSMEALKPILSEMARETRRMSEENRRLQDDLAENGRQIETLKRDLNTIRTQTLTDGLTGIANRRAFDEGMMSAISTSLEEGRPFCLLMVDIDHFKRFNDTHGHQTGDMVLKLVAKTLKDHVRETDLPARYGGEEFAVILPDTALEGAAHVGIKLNRMLAEKKLMTRRSNVDLGRITVSIGISQFVANDTVADLVERADAALYDAKKSGRNAVASRDHNNAIRLHKKA